MTDIVKNSFYIYRMKYKWFIFIIKGVKKEKKMGRGNDLFIVWNINDV